MGAGGCVRHALSHPHFCPPAVPRLVLRRHQAAATGSQPIAQQQDDIGQVCCGVQRGGQHAGREPDIPPGPRMLHTASALATRPAAHGGFIMQGMRRGLHRSAVATGVSLKKSTHDLYFVQGPGEWEADTRGQAGLIVWPSGGRCGPHRHRPQDQADRGRLGALERQGHASQGHAPRGLRGGRVQERNTVRASTPLLSPRCVCLAAPKRTHRTLRNEYPPPGISGTTRKGRATTAPARTLFRLTRV